MSLFNIEKEKAFISFYKYDSDLMKVTRKIIQPSVFIEPHIVEQVNRQGELIVDLVEKGIKESAFVIPIITLNSIKSQWVNQEIGFAKALKKPIYPIIDRMILNDLKGFVNTHVQLNYIFDLVSMGGTSGHFSTVMKRMLGDLEMIIVKRNRSQNPELNKLLHKHNPSGKPITKQFVLKTGKEVDEFLMKNRTKFYGGGEPSSI